MALKTFRVVQGLPRTPLLFFLDIAAPDIPTLFRQSVLGNSGGEIARENKIKVSWIDPGQNWGFEGHFHYIKTSIYRKSWKLKILLFGERENWRPGTHKVAHHFSAHFCHVKTPSIVIWGQKIKRFHENPVFSRFTNKCLVISCHDSAVHANTRLHLKRHL